MPQGGASARPARRYASSWSEELDGEAFRFPSAWEVRQARRAAASPRQPSPRQPSPRQPSPPAPVAVDAAAWPAQEAAAGVAVATRTVAAPPKPAPDTSAPAGTRRTITIRGHGAERNLPASRPTLRRHERAGFQPDRAALWAVLLGLCLILVAAASAHGAPLH